MLRILYKFPNNLFIIDDKKIVAFFEWWKWIRRNVLDQNPGCYIMVSEQ